MSFLVQTQATKTSTKIKSRAEARKEQSVLSKTQHSRVDGGLTSSLALVMMYDTQRFANTIALTVRIWEIEHQQYLSIEDKRLEEAHRNGNQNVIAKMNLLLHPTSRLAHLETLG